VITGVGRAFCAGADLEGLLSAYREDFTRYVDFQTKVHELYLTFLEHPLPIIAMVNGYALAGGFAIMLCCDMIIIADDALVGDQHTNYGLAGAGSMWLVAQHLGVQRALDLILSGKRLNGKEAEACGLALKSVPQARLEEEVENVVSRLRDKGRTTATLIKNMVRSTGQLPARQAFDVIYAAVLDFMANAEEPKEGIRAFTEKRKPQFK
jgi:enoyl-CoA hydratase/carnithine racemase